MSNNQPSTILSPELQFLIACCQTEPSEEDITFINTYLTQDTGSESGMTTARHSGLDPESTPTIISMASRHGILPLVYKTIKDLQPGKTTARHPEVLSVSPNTQPVIPNSFQDLDTGPESGMTTARHPELVSGSLNTLLPDLKSAYQAIACRNMLMSAELIRIMKLLETNGIEALAFKGPTLTQRLYGDITLRQFGDLDILIRKKDIYKIDALLKEQGYERLLALTPIQEEIWIKYAHDMGLIHKQKGIHFEMHWSFLDEDYPMQVDLEDFWKKTQTVKINGHDIPVFTNENLLYYLCIHGSKHLWERIEWIKDIDLMVRGCEIDWEKIVQTAKGSGFEKMLYLGLLLSASLFKTPLPKTVLEQISSFPELTDIESFILESWQTEKSTFAKTAAMLKLFPGVKEQALYLHKIILKPSFNEYWYVDLPKGLYWMYYLVRPYLLMKKYLTGASSEKTP